MDKSYPINTPMVVRSLDVEKDPFRPRKEEEAILGPHAPYLSAVGALMYLANSTRPNIAFVVNLLARHNNFLGHYYSYEVTIEALAKSGLNMSSVELASMSTFDASKDANELVGLRADTEE